MDGQMSIFDYPEFLPQEKQSVKTYSYPCDSCAKCEGLNRNCNTDPIKTSCNEFVNKNNVVPDAPTSDEDKARKCEYCAWWNNTNAYGLIEGCFWQKEYPGHLDPEELKTHSCWLPNTTTMKVCATCEHCNSFLYDGEDVHNPVINNDLYCSLSRFHNSTPINRRELFKEFRVKKEFGVGFYHRNHEYDTCDCWKESK